MESQAAILTGQDSLTRWIEAFVNEIEPLRRAHNDALWGVHTTADPAHQERSVELDTRMRTMLSRRDSYERLRHLGDSGAITEPLLARQLALLLRDHRENQIDPDQIAAIVSLERAVESRFNRFRATLDGRTVTDNELRGLLRDSLDGALRRRAWEASKQIGEEAVPDLLELVRRRNDAARSVGFENFYAMRLELDDLDEATLFGLLDELERGTRAPFADFKRELDAERAKAFGIETAALRPWHYQDPFFQRAGLPLDLDRHFEGKCLDALAESYFQTIGFDIRDLLRRADLFERPGKNQHAFCLSVDRGADVRILCNLRSNEFWMGALLHELGHAIYEQSLDADLPYLLRSPSHLLVTEASAMLFGRLARNGAWLERYAGARPERSAAWRAGLARATRTQLLVQTRWNLVMCHMERALYRDPAQDLDTLWWDLVERFQALTRPERRHAPDWASKIHFSIAPAYYHNYLLGEMTASHLQSHLLREVLGDTEDWDRYVSSPEVGAFLRERLYRCGKSLDWKATLRHATGRDLSPAAFVDELAR